MSDAELLEQIRKLQDIQKTHRPDTSAWKQASELLQPLFKQAAERFTS